MFNPEAYHTSYIGLVGSGDANTGVTVRACFNCMNALLHAALQIQKNIPFGLGQAETGCTC